MMCILYSTMYLSHYNVSPLLPKWTNVVGLYMDYWDLFSSYRQIHRMCYEFHISNFNVYVVQQ